MARTGEVDKPRKDSRSSAPARRRPESPPASGSADASVKLAAYEQFLALTSDGVWQFDVVPSVSTKLPPDEQAKAILARARLGFCNDAFARLFGLKSLEEAMGVPLSRLIAGSDEEKVRIIARAIGEGYRLTDVDLPTQDCEGHVVWTLNNIAAIVKRGRVTGGWGTSRDITERRATDAALQKTHADLRATLAASPDMVFEVDAEGRIHEFHGPDSAQLHAAPAEFLGKRIDETLPADASRVILEALRDAVAKGSHRGSMYSLAEPGRGLRWYELSIAEKGDAAGADARYVAIVRDVTDREAASAALRASEQLALALAAATDGVYDVDLRTGASYYSPGYYTMLGYEPGEFPPSQESWESLLHPEDRVRALQLLDDCLRGKADEYEMEFRLATKSGGWRWILSRGKVVARGEKGEVLRLVGTHRDVTARRETRDALRASEEKYRLLIENAGEAVFVLQDGVFKFANPATARILGRTMEEVLHRPFVDLVHPDDRAMVVSRHRRRLAGETDIELDFTFRVLYADGSPRWGEINAVRIEWEGRPATLNFASDITARRAAEEARRESEERFRRIFEESPIGMVTVGLDFRFTRANSTFCDMIGYTERELLGKSFVDITHPEHVDSDVESVQRVARGEIPSYRTEKRYIRKDRRVVWGALTVTAMRDADGRVQYFLSMIEDITARRESEAALAESERKYRELANDLPTCVFEADLSGWVTYANRTGLEWFGYDEEEIVGHKSITDMVAEGERERAARTMRRAIEDREVPTGEYTAVRRDGSSFPALVSSRAIMHDGRPIGVRGILIDISERVEAARRVERALAGTIHALAVTTEMRDPYTAGHQERVTKLAVAIGRKMELPEARLEGLRVAGLLHDVGKVSVPAEILSKPTELTQIEFALVRSHPETGHAILREIDFPWPVADIVLQHHERMDGSGYPNGLHGEEILLEARILAVADTVEAMASHRPYRAAFGIAEVLAELARGAGSIFDAAAASACQELFAEDGFQWDA